MQPNTELFGDSLFGALHGSTAQDIRDRAFGQAARELEGRERPKFDTQPGPDHFRMKQAV